MNNYFKNIVEENISQKLRLKNIDETIDYFLKDIKKNELMNRKHKKVSTAALLYSLLQLLDISEFLLLLHCLVFL